MMILDGSPKPWKRKKTRITTPANTSRP